MGLVILCVFLGGWMGDFVACDFVVIWDFLVIVGYLSLGCLL